ncbi:MAG: hypothetical protein ACR2FO_08640 [Actinomycetota bacterium]
MADKTTANPTMWLNKGSASRRGPSMDGLPQKGPRMFKTTSLVLLAVSPFLAYVLLLPKDPPATEPFKGSASQSTPAPSISPSPFVAIPVPEISSEPLFAEASPSSTANQPKKKVAPQPAPAPSVAPEVPAVAPVDASPLPPPPEEPPSSGPDDGCDINSSDFGSCIVSGSSSDQTP